MAGFINGYPSGTVFQNSQEVSSVDFIFGISITTSTLSIDDDYEFNKEIRLFPNPSSDFIIISNLETIEKYSILNACRTRSY